MQFSPFNPMKRGRRKSSNISLHYCQNLDNMVDYLLSYIRLANCLLRLLHWLHRGENCCSANILNSRRFPSCDRTLVDLLQRDGNPFCRYTRSHSPKYVSMGDCEQSLVDVYHREEPPISQSTINMSHCMPLHTAVRRMKRQNLVIE